MASYPSSNLVSIRAATTSFTIDVSRCVLLKSKIPHSLPEITLMHDSDNMLIRRNLIRTCRSEKYLQLLSQKKKKKKNILWRKRKRKRKKEPFLQQKRPKQKQEKRKKKQEQKKKKKNREKKGKEEKNKKIKAADTED